MRDEFDKNLLLRREVNEGSFSVVKTSVPSHKPKKAVLCKNLLYMWEVNVGSK